MRLGWVSLLVAVWMRSGRYHCIIASLYHDVVVIALLLINLPREVVTNRHMHYCGFMPESENASADHEGEKDDGHSIVVPTCLSSSLACAYHGNRITAIA